MCILFHVLSHFPLAITEELMVCTCILTDYAFYAPLNLVYLYPSILPRKILPSMYLLPSSIYVILYFYSFAGRVVG